MKIIDNLFKRTAVYKQLKGDHVKNTSLMGYVLSENKRLEKRIETLMQELEHKTEMRFLIKYADGKSEYIRATRFLTELKAPNDLFFVDKYEHIIATRYRNNENPVISVDSTSISGLK